MHLTQQQQPLHHEWMCRRLVWAVLSSGSMWRHAAISLYHIAICC